jgi:type VI protein secretion system component Hcp
LDAPTTRRLLPPLAALLLGLLAPGAARAERIYMLVPGLTGEVVTAPFAGTIELDSITLATGGKPLTLVHEFDRATPGLLTAAATGKVLETVTVTVQTEAGQTYLVLTLKEVVVSKVELSVADEPARVQTELRAARVDLEYTTTDARGSKTASERASISGGK